MIAAWIAFSGSFLAAGVLSGFYHDSGYTGTLSGFFTTVVILCWTLTVASLCAAIGATAEWFEGN